VSTTKTKAKSNGHVDENVVISEVPIIEISRIEAETIKIPIVGTAPLICNRFSEKAKRKMLDDMQGKKSPKNNRNPRDDYEAAFYKIKDGYGFPAIAFKAATVDAARFYGKEVTMTGLRQFLFTTGEPSEDGQPCVRIEGDPEMREDVVTVGRGGTDLRYRPMFSEWWTDLTVTYITSQLSKDSLLSLIDAGGMGVGIGEWRPEKKGLFGTYTIDEAREIEVVK